MWWSLISPGCPVLAKPLMVQWDIIPKMGQIYHCINHCLAYLWSPDAPFLCCKKKKKSRWGCRGQLFYVCSRECACWWIWHMVQRVRNSNAPHAQCAFAMLTGYVYTYLCMCGNSAPFVRELNQVPGCGGYPPAPPGKYNSEKRADHFSVLNLKPIPYNLPLVWQVYRYCSMFFRTNNHNYIAEELIKAPRVVKNSKVRSLLFNM